jgi:hypothetical protein
MKIQGREYCLALSSAPDGDVSLGLYEGTIAVGAPVAECSYADTDDSLTVTTYAADIPPAALEWLRGEAPRVLPDAGDFDVPHDQDERPLWYYLGGVVVLFGNAVYRWRHVARHGGVATALLVAAAGFLLIAAYYQHLHNSRAMAPHDAA